MLSGWALFRNGHAQNIFGTKGTPGVSVYKKRKLSWSPEMHLKPLNEQTIVITGGSSGIGLATAERAAREGANVVIIARGEDALQKAASEVRTAGGRCDYVAADVTSREQVRTAVATIIERHGGFDTWVSDAGVAVYSKLEELDDEDHRQVFETNYWGVVHCATEALPHLKKRGGALVTMGSISSQMPAPLLSSYTASKYAVKGYIDSLRLELMHEDAPVSITLIQPSGINTPFSKHALNEADGRAQVPPPVYDPKIVAEAVCNAAEKPVRDMIVGGAGRAMTLLANLAPGLADHIFEKAFFATALRDQPKRKSDGGFHKSGAGGEIYGDQNTGMRSTSLYTRMRMHPAATAVALLAVAAGTAGLLKRKA